LLLAAFVAVALTSVAFAQGGGKQNPQQATFEANLAPLNNSGANGTATLMLKGNQLSTDIESEGMAEGLPHAQHIHGRAQAISECPTLAADQNGDGLVNTAEGQPAYGPILVSLTTRGDTSPSSGLAVDRFPVAGTDGSLDYSRTFEVPGKVAANLGDFHIVQHGVDLNNNGVYDFEAAGASELDPSLPQEATIPANCGPISPVSG
jgi:hypothetical protein